MRSTLHWAASHGRYELVEVLIQIGGIDHINTLDQFGRSPLHSAVVKGNEDMVSQLLKNGAVTETAANLLGYRWAVLHCAIAGGNHNILEMLLASEANPHTTTTLSTHHIHRPLMHAVILGDIAAVLLLLRYGAGVWNTPSSEVASIVWYAGAIGRRDLMELLESEGYVSTTTSSNTLKDLEMMQKHKRWIFRVFLDCENDVCTACNRLAATIRLRMGWSRSLDTGWTRGYGRLDGVKE
ncbi:ankyrin repeat-containing domain protein [Trichophaea hybrida]|nr:ankyrin repeat-containing domain protein [Trichophaea hybrida]